jgi:uncharacterized protein YbjQ (UPF0145 family)
MNLRQPVSSLFACAVVITSISGALGQGIPKTAPLRVFEPTELTRDRYTILKRIWVESWRSALWIPFHENAADAIAALQAEAAGLGADGIANLSCFNDRASATGKDSFFCYGNAIKLK